MKIISLKDKLGNILVPKKWEPIGKILMFDRKMNMSQFYYGTWELCLKERSPIGVNIDSTDDRFKTSGQKFGEKTHTLTISEIPNIRNYNAVWSECNLMTGGTAWSYSADKATEEHQAVKKGGGQSHNNIHPVETVYFYKRVA